MSVHTSSNIDRENYKEKDKEKEKENQIVKKLKVIKSYVFQRMVFEWLGNFLQGDGHSYSIDIAGSFRIEIKRERIANKSGHEDGYRPELITVFLIFNTF